MVTEALSLCPDTDDLVKLLDSIGNNTLNLIAPLKLRRAKVKASVQPWLNGTTCVLRQECRQAECKVEKGQTLYFL